MKTIFLAWWFTALTVQVSAAAPAGPKDFKRVSFDDFFAGQVVSVPLSLEIPSQYVHADGLEVPPTYSYWMRKEEVALAAKSENLPTKTGYIYGKVSTDEGFDQKKGKFTSQDQAEAQLAAGGMKLIEKKRVVVQGFPAFSYIVRAKNGTIVCSLFVATLMNTNVLYLGYRPPNNDLGTAKEVWAHVLASVRGKG